ncbi:hypothetical protein N9878_01310 [bacterium]|nr:hypothetical protein [bacterium]
MNKAKCLKCEDIIQSKHTHDFVRCKCGEIFVDGGDDYWRAGAADMQNFQRVMDDEHPNAADAVEKSE